MLNEIFQQNASKFAICLEYENFNFFFHFVLLYFPPNKCPGLRRHIPSKAFIREEKNKVEQNEKTM